MLRKRSDRLAVPCLRYSTTSLMKAPGLTIAPKAAMPSETTPVISYASCLTSSRRTTINALRKGSFVAAFREPSRGCGPATSALDFRPGVSRPPCPSCLGSSGRMHQRDHSPQSLP